MKCRKTVINMCNGMWLESAVFSKTVARYTLSTALEDRWSRRRSSATTPASPSTLVGTTLPPPRGMIPRMRSSPTPAANRFRLNHGRKQRHSVSKRQRSSAEKPMKKYAKESSSMGRSESYAFHFLYQKCIKTIRISLDLLFLITESGLQITLVTVF